MEDIRYGEQFPACQPIERQSPGRPLKNPHNGYNREAGTGHLLA